ncbi:DUF2357 domain-containing protein [Paenibacillus sp. 8b26]|uniref:DUF2357 domain-containing protein n=1 Tax=Paenibacillus sp. 8b26 TaxID=3424133 RepID=UPI003D645D3B
MYYKDDALPFVLEFFTGNQEHQIKNVTDFWDGHQEVAANSIRNLIQVKEGVQIGVRLYSKEGHNFDYNAKVVIETSTYDEIGQQILFTVPISQRNNNDYLYKNESKREFPWRMGVYFIEVHYQNKSYISGIFVAPIHLSIDQVQHLHLLLEKEVEGICYELMYTSKSTSSDYLVLKSKSYYDYVLTLVNKKEKIVSTLSRLQRSIPEQVITDYVPNLYQKKTDHKSLRWKTIRGTSMELNKKKVLSVNIPENRWIKHILISWKNDMLNIEKELEEDYKRELMIIHSKEEEKLQREQRRAVLWNEREISQASKDSLHSTIFRLSDDIKSAERKIAILVKWRKLINNIIGRLTFILTSTNLKEVELIKKRIHLKNRNYRDVYELYVDCKKSIFDDGNSKHVVQILKPTWKIYEQFVYFQVVSMLQKYGFGISDTCDLEKLQELNSGFCIELENEDLVAHVWYDKVIHLREDAKVYNDDFFASQLIQPDIRIDLYKKGEHHVFISMLVLDAKHRKYKSLFSDAFTSIVAIQLSKYQNIFYRGEHTVQSRRRSVISSVLCVYSRDTEAQVKTEDFPYVFIQLFPDLNKDQMIGYDELYQEFANWLNESKSEYC